ncbi:MAG: hypothetical protein ACUVQ0_00360 [Thermoproteota archaeon]
MRGDSDLLGTGYTPGGTSYIIEIGFVEEYLTTVNFLSVRRFNSSRSRMGKNPSRPPVEPMLQTFTIALSPEWEHC